MKWNMETRGGKYTEIVQESHDSEICNITLSYESQTNL